MSNEDIAKELTMIIENLIGTKVSLDDSLITSRLIDSMGVIDLTMELEENFGIQIQAPEVKVENFETVRILAEFILKKQEALQE